MHPGLVMAPMVAVVTMVVTQAAGQTAAPAAGAGGAGAAPANTAASGFTTPRPTALEQIVVTANKRRELQRRVADSVTAISGRDLDRRQEVTLQDLAAQVPGLSLETDDKSAVRIVLRGLNTGSAGATVASLLDEVPTNPAGAQNNASTNTPNFDTYDLQRIEVLRGPQGTLYGATAEGGLIKYVTNPPDPARYAGGLETSVDGATDGGIGGTLKGFINVPFADGKAAFRLTGWNEWFPGYIDNPDTGKTESNSGQQYGWRASLLMQPVEDLSIRLTAERQSLFGNNEDNVDVAGYAANLMAPPGNQLSLTNGLRNATALTQPSQNETAVYYANVNYDFGWSNLTSVTAFSFAKFTSLFDDTNTNVAPGVTIATDLQEAVYGVPLVVDERQNSNTDKFSQELRLASDPGQTLFGRDFEWLGGGYYTHETSAFLQNIDARNAANLNDTITQPVGPPGGLNLYGALSEWAVFGQVDYHFLPSFDVELGGRWSGNAQHSTSGFACCLLYGPAQFQPTISSNDHNALYSVAPRWRPTDDTMLYGRIATGYRPGGPNIPIPGVTGLPLTYKPDRTVNYEIGVRQDLFDKTVSIDITGYYINWKSVQILSLVNTPSGPTGVNGNAGSAVSKGVEWDLAWSPLRGLKIEAVGGYTDARLAVNAPGLGGQNGDFLPYVPDVQNSVNVEYSWAPIDGVRAFASGTWSYTGVRYTSFAPASGVTESHVQLPGYNTGAIRLGAERGRYSAELYVNNISDSHALTYYANQGGVDQTGLATLIVPRIIGFVARVGF
jgi:outer membrane receptor protein involved in Fe transport